MLHKGDGQLGLNWALSLFDFFLGLNNWALDIKWAHDDNNKYK